MFNGHLGAAIFDMEYARWLEDDHRHMSELRTALQAHLSDGDLRIIVDGYINHYDEIFRLKGVAAKSDVFHLITGMWTTPAERCFLWMGGFRPSELIKVPLYHIFRTLNLDATELVIYCSIKTMLNLSNGYDFFPPFFERGRGLTVMK